MVDRCNNILDSSGSNNNFPYVIAQRTHLDRFGVGYPKNL